MTATSGAAATESAAVAAAHVMDSPQIAAPRNGVGCEAVESARKTVKGRRCHQVPGTLQRWEPAEIVGSLRAGRNVEQTSKEYNCTAQVSLECWLRDVERRLAALARPVAAMSFLLMGVAVADVWTAAAGDGVTVQRAFGRNGRARKRGLEDGTGLVELAQAAVAAGGAA